MQRAAPSESVEAALRAARARRSGLILIEKPRLPELQAADYPVVLERPDWALIEAPH